VSHKEIGRADFIDDLGYFDLEEKNLATPQILISEGLAHPVCLGADELPAAAPVVRWPSERRVRDCREGCHHPGLDLQIIVLALPSHFFLMRSEIVYALSDFVAL